MNNVQKCAVIFLSAIAPFFGLVTRVYAEEIVISGNGNESASAVQSNQNTSVNTSQDNTASVQNTVAVTANTGNNTANNNTNGDTAITTGDIAITEEITNNTNASVVANGECCQGEPGQISLSNNGSGSTNNVSRGSSSNMNVTVNNSATITNSVNGYASTGNNTANNNSGNVSLKTGDIWVKEKIITNANLSYISASSPLNKNYILTISGNGSDSINTISDNSDSDIVIAVNNTAHIFNSSFWNLITGNNNANDNNGDVAIETGDIDFESTITNNTNLSVVLVTCCNKEEKPEPIVPPEKPVSPKSDNNSAQGASASSGSSNGSSTPGSSLPSTGNMWFFLALVANIAALLYGTYLRLRSGRSPAYALA